MSSDVKKTECILHAEEIQQRHQEVVGKLEAIERRLFKDNGTPSIQTRLDRHEQILKVLLWATSIVVGTALTSGVLGMIFIFKSALVHGSAP
jgi:hypothetical protein